MTTENAILLLSKRAEYAQAKADTPDKQRKAKDYVEITNTIIDYYNRTETLQSEIRNLQDIVRLLLEHLGVRSYDADTLIHTDAKFMRYWLTVESLMFWQRNPDTCISRQDWIFHNIASRWEHLQHTIQEIDTYRNFFIPLVEKKMQAEVDGVLFNHQTTDTWMSLHTQLNSLHLDMQKDVAANTDYSLQAEYETYLKQ